MFLRGKNIGNMMKVSIRLFLIALLFNCGIPGLIDVGSAYAQPANNICSGNIAVTPDGSCTAGTTVLATDNWIGTVGCQAGNNPEVWYSFVADSTVLGIEVTAGTMTGNLEFILVEAPLLCMGGLTLTGSSCGPSVLTDTITGLTIGQNYMFTISSSTGGDGTFNVCITSIEIPPISAGDCIDAVDVCTNPFFKIQPDGFGSVMEIPALGSVGNPFNANPGGSGNFGCLQAFPPETNSTWMIVTISNSGLLEFTFGGNGTQVGYYDWIMYPWNPNVCTDIPGGNYAPVRCNWNGVNFGGTGLTSTIPLGGHFSNYEPPLPVVCGEKFIICFSNWSSVSTSVPLDFYGTASVICNPPDIVVSVIPPNPTICLGESVVLTASGADIYTWTPATGLSDTTGTSVIASPTVTTTYTLRGFDGCFSGDTTVTVTVQAPSAGFTFTGDQCLATNNIGFTNTGDAPGSCGAGCPTYSWDFGNGTNSSGTNTAAANPSITYTSGGTYIVTQIVDDGTCVASFSLPVVISDPVSIIVGTEESCNGGCDGAVDFTISGGSAPYTYTWNTGPVTEDLIDVCAGFYSITTVDVFGCLVTDTVTLQPIIDVVAGFTASPDQCLFGNSFDFTNTGDAPGSCGGNCPLYWWDFGDGTNVTGTDAASANPSHIYSAFGTYTVTQVVTDAAGCTDTATTIIEVYEAPTVSLVSVDESCFNACDGIITLTTTGGASIAVYAWSNGSGSQNLTGLCGGNYSVTVTDVNGCIDSTTIVLNTGVDIKAGFGYDGDKCLTGNSFDFVNSGSSVGVCGPGCPTYTWDFGDLNTQSGTTAGDASPTHVYGTPGTYTVTQIVSDGTCADTVIRTITVFDEPTTSIVATAGSCDSTCDGLADLTVVGGTMSYTYNWSNFETAQDNSGLCAGTAFVTVTDANGCTVIDSVVIATGAGITATSVTVDVSCMGMSDGTATATGAGGVTPFTYLWSNGDSTAMADSLTAGTFYVTVTDSAGCTTIDTVVIAEPLTGLSSAVAFTDVSCFGGNDGTATAIGSGGTSPYTYSWTNGDNTAGADSLIAGMVYVTISDSNGCSTTDSALIGEPVALSNIVVKTDVNCNGGNDGTATATPSGGTTPYTYSWSNGDGTAIADSLSMGTYTVTVSDAKSCIDSISVTITEPTAMILTGGSIDASCGASDGKVFVTVTGGTGAYTYLWNDIGAQTTDTAFSVSAAAYVVVVTDSAGCVDSVTATVSNAGAPTVSITSFTNVSCFGGNDGSAMVTASGGLAPYTYLWDDLAAQTNAAAVGLIAGTYVNTVTDSGGCIATVVQDILEPTALALTPSFTDANCGQSDGTAAVAVTGGTGAYTYAWDDIGTQTTANAGSLVTGVYQVVVSDSNACSDSVSVTIADIPGGTVTITALTNASCNGLCDGTATSLITGGFTPYTYSWNDLGTQTTAQATGLCFGFYTVYSTDSAGCLDSASVAIGEPTALLATTDTTDASCNGVCDGALQAIASGGTGAFTYAWDNLDSTATSTGLCAGPYVVTVTDANGCSVITGGTITEPTALVLTMGSVDAQCNGANGNASVNVTGGYSPYTYLWNDGGAQTTDTAINLLAGTYLATVMDSAGCLDTASVVVVNAGVPTASILTAVNVSCFGLADGKAGVEAANGVTPYTYQWDDPGTQTTDTAYNLIAGFYTVTITDADGCFAVDTVTITEPAAMLAPITVTNISCFGVLDGGMCVAVSGGTGPYTYSWYDGSTSACMTGVGAVVGGCVDITDAMGCTLQVCDDITEPAQLTIVPNTVQPTCFGDCDGIATVVVSGGTTPYGYAWDDPANQGGSSAGGLCDGTYIVVVTDLNGCTIDETFTVVEPLQIIDQIVGTPVMCVGVCDGTSTLNTTSASPPYTYNWSDPNSQTNITATGLCQGTFSVTVIGATGCTENTTITIGLSPDVPVADFDATPNPTNLFNPAVTFANLSLPDPLILGSAWDFGDSSNSTMTDPIHIYEDTGTFFVELVITDANGCKDSITKIIVIEGSYILFVPTSFTPNGDGYNDYFFPKGVGIDSEEFEMFIYDRWGDQIFKTEDYNLPWDGRANKGSNVAQEDVYIWVIKTRDTGNNVPHQYVGHVTLIR
ncbi:MAG TPA: PKD domain-containing protein [Flavobacteriales bacterium]|nr:PKD domain-containing protein [Flavobacteriales bacterium]